MTELFLLRNLQAGFIGNSPMWWAHGGGYTQWIDDARRFTLEEAKREEASSPKKFERWSLDGLEKIARRTVDIQDMT